MTLTPNQIDINKAIAVCTRNGVTVTSIEMGRRFMVKVIDNGVEELIDKPVYAHRLNSAIKKTWRYYAAMILNKANAD